MALPNSSGDLKPTKLQGLMRSQPGYWKRQQINSLLSWQPYSGPPNQQATVPEEWRKANVVPIFKKGDHAAASNYRPVSLTSICSKVMEHIVSSQVMRHLDLNNILDNAQHGFRKRRSCESQLLLSANDFLKSLDGSTQMDAILLDFAKAFDKVAHKRLLLKLEAIGITGNTLGWIESCPVTSGTDRHPWGEIIRHQPSHIRSAPRHSSQAPFVSGVHKRHA